MVLIETIKVKNIYIAFINLMHSHFLQCFTNSNAE